LCFQWQLYVPHTPPRLRALRWRALRWCPYTSGAGGGGNLRRLTPPTPHQQAPPCSLHFRVSPFAPLTGRPAAPPSPSRFREGRVAGHPVTPAPAPRPSGQALAGRAARPVAGWACTGPAPNPGHTHQQLPVGPWRPPRRCPCCHWQPPPSAAKPWTPAAPGLGWTLGRCAAPHASPVPLTTRPCRWTAQWASWSGPRGPPPPPSCGHLGRAPQTAWSPSGSVSLGSPGRLTWRLTAPRPRPATPPPAWRPWAL
jgi:hypothetical protein